VRITCAGLDPAEAESVADAVAAAGGQGVARLA
jgi:hypothetical protein